MPDRPTPLRATSAASAAATAADPPVTANPASAVAALRTADLRRQVEVISPAKQTVRRFRRHRLAVTGLIVLTIVVLAAILAPFITQSAGPDVIDLRARNEGPSAAHWLGTDRTGRDTFTRLIYAGRVSLAVGVVAVMISVAIGTTLGAIAGFFGGAVDSTIMRVTDVIMTFPAIIILLTVAAIIGPGITQTVVVIGLLNWPVPCRLVRSKLLSIREQEFIQAARAMGATRGRVLASHALPNALDVLIVYSSLGIATVILLEAGLSFLGLGVQPPTPSWGNMLNVARNVAILEQYPWQWLPAGIAIVIVVLCVNFIGDGLRDALDPRMKL